MKHSSLLYLRSRALPGALAALVGTAAAAAWAAWWLQSLPDLDHTARLPVVVLGPLLAAAAIGTSLHTPSDELDRTAVRAWWPRRLAHVLAPAVLAVALLALAVPGHAEEFGALAAVRNTLGLVGVTASAAAVVGARLSWLPLGLPRGHGLSRGPLRTGRRCAVVGLGDAAGHPGGGVDGGRRRTRDGDGPVRVAGRATGDGRVLTPLSGWRAAPEDPARRVGTPEVTG